MIELLTIDEAAERLQVEPTEVRDQITARHITTIQFKGEEWVDAADIASNAEGTSTHDRGEYEADPPLANARPFTMDDPLWDVIGRWGGTERVSITEDKDRLIANAIQELHNA